MRNLVRHFLAFIVMAGLSSAMTAPAMVAQPPVITANNSDSDMLARYGFTTRGASV